MTPNVGTIDRIARLIMGVLLVVAPFATGLALFSSTIATVVAVAAGVVLIATSAFKFCPLYRIFGIRTCQV